MFTDALLGGYGNRSLVAASQANSPSSEGQTALSLRDAAPAPGVRTRGRTAPNPLL